MSDDSPVEPVVRRNFTDAVVGYAANVDQMIQVLMPFDRTVSIRYDTKGPVEVVLRTGPNDCVLIFR